MVRATLPESIEVIEKIVADMAKAPAPTVLDRLKSRLWGNRRRLKKRLRGYRPNMSHNRADFLKHRYPHISLEEMRLRVARFQQLLNYDKELKVDQFANQFFLISKGVK